jgi:hypothetical protein
MRFHTLDLGDGSRGRFQEIGQKAVMDMETHAALLPLATQLFSPLCPCIHRTGRLHRARQRTRQYQGTAGALPAHGA